MRASCSSPPALTRTPRHFTETYFLVMLILRADFGPRDRSWQRCLIQAQCRSHSHRHAALVARRLASSSAPAPSVTLCGTAARCVRERTGVLTSKHASAPMMCTRPIVKSFTTNDGQDHQTHIDQCMRCILSIWRKGPPRATHGHRTLPRGIMSLHIHAPCHVTLTPAPPRSLHALSTVWLTRCSCSFAPGPRILQVTLAATSQSVHALARGSAVHTTASWLST